VARSPETAVLAFAISALIKIPSFGSTEAAAGWLCFMSSLRISHDGAGQVRPTVSVGDKNEMLVDGPVRFMSVASAKRSKAKSEGAYVSQTPVGRHGPEQRLLSPMPRRQSPTAA
jgi:hypothetical protein